MLPLPPRKRGREIVESRMPLKDRTLFITGASRGIGLAIALRAAREGANIFEWLNMVDGDPRRATSWHHRQCAQYPIPNDDEQD
jgi:hypothetical protein